MTSLAITRRKPACKSQTDSKLCFEPQWHVSRHLPFYLNQRRFRRCRLSTFPHLILYRETTTAIRIMVLKHVKRAPGHGLGRR